MERRQDGRRNREVEALEEQLRRVTRSAESAIPEQDKTSSSKDAGPSDAEINNLSLLYQSRKFDEAEKLALSFTGEVSQHVLGWKILGALYGQTGRV